MADDQGEQVKRKVTAVVSDGSTKIDVSAVITTDGILTRHEVERIADELRDRLMMLPLGLKFTAFHLSKVQVS